MKGIFPIDKFRTLQTPFYYYDTKVLRDTLSAINHEVAKYPNYSVHYAVKANANPKVLTIIRESGMGADCVSGGEIRAAIRAGFPANKVVFAGVGKADWEINLGLEYGIFCFNVESIPELEVINELQDKLEARRILVEHINVGGGLGIDYGHPNRQAIPNFKDYFATYAGQLKLRPYQTLHFELGRAVVGQCGSLISKVLYVKQGTRKKFAILDAGMTDLIRPALYQAFHKMENITSEEPLEAYDVVGPICESSDVFGKAIDLNKVKRGDLIALRSAGAYGEIMASGYNCRELPKGYTSDELV